MQLLRVWQQSDYPYSTKYAEVSQQRPCTFSFAIQDGDTLKEMNRPIKCRDFFLDTLVWEAGEHGSIPTRIWGWDYKGAFDKKFTSLVIYDYGNIEKNIAFLNEIEKKMGLMPTEVKVVENCVWTKGAAFWQLTTVHLSWYTNLLRLLTYDNEIKSWGDLTRDSWIEDREWEIFKLFPEILPNLNVKQVSGTKLPVQSAHVLHDFSGWWSASKEERQKFTYYGEQINGILASRAVPTV